MACIPETHCQYDMFHITIMMQKMCVKIFILFILFKTGRYNLFDSNVAKNYIIAMKT